MVECRGSEAATLPAVLAVFVPPMFTTGYDEANRAAVRAVPSAELRLAGWPSTPTVRSSTRLSKG